MTGGTVSKGFVIGGSSTHGDATGNAVTISGGSVEWDVLGGQTASSCNATGNTVTLASGSVRNVYGGKCDQYFSRCSSYDAVSGNTLRVDKAKNFRANRIYNFEKLVFTLPAGMSAGDTMLTVGNAANLSSVAVTVIDDSSGNLPGMVTLISKTSGAPASTSGVPSGYTLDASGGALVLRALYSITVNDDPRAGFVGCSTTTDIAHGTGTSTCTATAFPGYSFGGMTVSSGTATVNCNGLDCTVSKLESDIVLRPTFTEQFTVQVATGIANGSLTGCSPTEVNHGEDVTVTCTATADPGYDFSNMTLTDGASNNSCDVTTCDLANVQGGVTVGATFTKRKYGVMVNSATGGSVKCDPDTDIEHGTGTSDCTVTEDPGYTFGGMTVDSGTGDISCSGLVCTLSKLESSVAVQPTFTLNEYSVSDATPAGSGGSMNCASPVKHGESTRCDAAPDAGYAFDTMDIDQPGKATLGTCDANGCELTGVVGDVTVTGVFKALPPTPQPQQPSDNGGATPQPRQPYVISNTPTMGELGLLLSSLALVGAAAPALRRREKQGKKADTRQ